jgi:hypothetical protein
VKNRSCATGNSSSTPKSFFAVAFLVVIPEGDLLLYLLLFVLAVILTLSAVEWGSVPTKIEHPKPLNPFFHEISIATEA